MKSVICWLLMLLCVPMMAQAIDLQQKEVLLRSFRLKKDYRVQQHVFEQFAKEQLLDRYYVYEQDGKKSLVELYQWTEMVGFLGDSSIHYKKTEAETKIPTMSSIEAVEMVAEGELRATLLSPASPLKMAPLIYVKLPEGVSYSVGEKVSCALLLEDRSAFTAKIPIGVKTYKMLSEQEAKAWYKPTLKDLSKAYASGKTFLVKAKTHKTTCNACNGTGVDKAQMARIENEIKASKTSKRSMLSSDSKNYRLRQMNRNKPKCKVCEGKKFLLLEEFRTLNIRAD